MNNIEITKSIAMKCELLIAVTIVPNHFDRLNRSIWIHGTFKLISMISNLLKKKYQETDNFKTILEKSNFSIHSPYAPYRLDH